MPQYEERTVYKIEEPKLFEKIEKAFEDSGSLFSIDGKLCIILEVVPRRSAVIVERFREP